VGTFNSKEVDGLELFGPKEVLKEAQNRPYCAHVFLPTMKATSIMIGDGREPK
jgi:hypothetical protein